MVSYIVERCPHLSESQAKDKSKYWNFTLGNKTLTEIRICENCKKLKEETGLPPDHRYEMVVELDDDGNEI